jgi:hypothetical protein
MSDINNPFEDGIEAVEPHEDDNAEPTTYFDPDEDQDTEEADLDEATDEAESEEVDTEAPAPVALVKLPDGTEAPLEEVTKGYLRQVDYTRKTQEVAETRKALEADLQRIEGITQAFVDHLSSMVPAQPDPALALRDPNAYVRQKAQYDAAMAQVQKLIEIGNTPKEIKGALGEKDTQQRLAEENAKLAERFPTVTTQEGRTKFFAAAAEAAQAAGFTMDDLKGVSDHRLFVLAHWANEGIKAAKARETAKAKVANVPPAAPRKPGQPAATNRDAQAMRKFKSEPTLRNAAKLDWI